MNTKQCRKCREVKSIEEFGKLSSSKDGKHYNCKPCVNANQRQYNKDNPDYVKAHNQNRRAYKLALPNTLKRKEWTNIKAMFDWKCAFTDSTKTSLEHVIPLNWGRMGNEVGNVLPMDKALNQSKQAKNVIDWAEQPELEPLIDWKRFYKAMKYLAEVNGFRSCQEYYDFINWCERNKRTPEAAAAATISSIEEFKESKLLNV
ncbi:hypothetical protein [Priestia flexa]|uniref:hypothetical protein n=1 Tax=Priestia flexa TaxID=86664 RepID=UPI00099BE714|nr:hypothetical protein [Priestia flexa]AQX56031.1 hypothetical protein BC359_18120 [Priestia flexa]